MFAGPWSGAGAIHSGPVMVTAGPDTDGLPDWMGEEMLPIPRDSGLDAKVTFGIVHLHLHALRSCKRVSKTKYLQENYRS